MVLNHIKDEVLLETEIQFTINNIVHSYTPYDLDAGLTGDSNGKGPGVQALIRLLGGWDRPKVEKKESPSPQGGRPRGDETTGKYLKKSAREISRG